MSSSATPTLERSPKGDPYLRAEARFVAHERRVGVWAFRPANERQAAVLECARRGCLVVGGNRSGKTVVGAVAMVLRHLEAAARTWCVSQLLPGATDKPHVQLEEIRRWAPPDALRGDDWNRAYSPGARTLTWANGGTTEFKSYDQELLQFESAGIDRVWFDEEPTRKEIFTSCLMRLIDRRGRWMMTLTPVLSLEGRGAVAEELWDNREKPDAQYETFQLFTTDNPHLDAETLEQTFAGLTEEERQVRAYGAFARLGGRVLSELDPSRHFVPGFAVPREWTHYLIIDPGWVKTAALWAAADRNGRIWLYDEHYEGELRPEQHMQVLHAQWGWHGKPDVDVLMDPAGFNLHRTTTGVESPSDADEYRAAAAKLGATWFTPRLANNGDPMAWRVKRYLAADLLRIQNHLAHWRWEAERWTRQRERQGVVSQENPVPERPVRRNDHLMAATRYLCNELPEVAAPPEKVPTRLEAFWDRMNAKMREEERIARMEEHEGSSL